MDYTISMLKHRAEFVINEFKNDKLIIGQDSDEEFVRITIKDFRQIDLIEMFSAGYKYGFNKYQTITNENTL